MKTLKFSLEDQALSLSEEVILGINQRSTSGEYVVKTSKSNQEEIPWLLGGNCDLRLQNFLLPLCILSNKFTSVIL